MVSKVFHHLLLISNRDLHADDNGFWTTSSPCRKYVVEMEGDQVLSAQMSDCSSNGDDDSSVVTIYRQYRTHKGTPNSDG